MMSMFSASNAARKLTTCFAFSLVMVHPKSARAVMFREVKTVERGYIARLHWPSRLKAISIFSSPVSMLFKRWVNMIGVLQTVVGIAFFSSMWLMPFSE